MGKSNVCEIVEECLNKGKKLIGKNKISEYWLEVYSTCSCEEHLNEGTEKLKKKGYKKISYNGKII